MKVAVIGSRSLTVQNLEEYLPQDVTEIVSGGAKGSDTCVREYAHQAGLKLTEFLPDYQRYGPQRTAAAKAGDHPLCGRGDRLLGRTIPRHPVCR